MASAMTSAAALIAQVEGALNRYAEDYPPEKRDQWEQQALAALRELRDRVGRLEAAAERVVEANYATAGLSTQGKLSLWNAVADLEEALRRVSGVRLGDASEHSGRIR